MPLVARRAAIAPAALELPLLPRVMASGVTCGAGARWLMRRGFRDDDDQSCQMSEILRHSSENMGCEMRVGYQRLQCVPRMHR